MSASTASGVAPLVDPMGSFRTCTRCGVSRHLAQFPALEAGRSPICVCCPPHTLGGGLYQQSVAVTEEPSPRRRQSPEAQSFRVDRERGTV